SPNVAKEMHAGHLRSTIIGDSLARLLHFRGHQVLPQNHLGDWGTPFGMLLEHMVDEGWDRGGGPPNEHHGSRSVTDLGEFYQAARRRFDSDDEFAGRARKRVVALQSGDPGTLALWREFVAETERYLERLYDLLGVGLTHADICGESFYNPLLAGV